MNAPTWYYRIFYGSAGIKMMKTAVLNFCGISPTKTTLIGNLRFTKEDYRKKWLEKVRKLGLNRK